MFSINGTPVSIDNPFTTEEGVTYPHLRDPSVRQALGVVEVADPAYYDQRFYWGVGNPKQLEDLENNIITRRRNYQTQINFFRQYEEFFTLPTETESARTGWLAFPVIIKSTAPFERRDFQIFLEKRNVQTRVVFTGNITRQPGFKNLEMRKSANLQNSDNIMRGGVLLACHHGLNQEMINHMHATIEEFLKTKI